MKHLHILLSFNFFSLEFEFWVHLHLDERVPAGSAIDIALGVIEEVSDEYVARAPLAVLMLGAPRVPLVSAFLLRRKIVLVEVGLLIGLHLLSGGLVH